MPIREHGSQGDRARAFDRHDADEGRLRPTESAGGSGPGSERRENRNHGSRVREGQRVRSRMAAEQAAERGIRYIARFTGKEPETVTTVTPSDGGWTVGVEVVEDRRIPSSSDILAVYEADIDADGEIASYRRRTRYSRGRGSTEGQAT